MSDRKTITFLRDSTEEDNLETIYSGVEWYFVKNEKDLLTLPSECEDETEDAIFFLVNITDDDGDIQYYVEIPKALEGDLWEFSTKI